MSAKPLSTAIEPNKASWGRPHPQWPRRTYFGAINSLFAPNILAEFDFSSWQFKNPIREKA